MTTVEYTTIQLYCSEVMLKADIIPLIRGHCLASIEDLPATVKSSLYGSFYLEGEEKYQNTNRFLGKKQSWPLHGLVPDLGVVLMSRTT